MAGRVAVVLRAITAALALFAAMGPAAHAEKRVALVIGNSAYTHARALPNPDNDAKLMSDTPLSLGFFVVGGGAKLDLDKEGFDTALKEFQKELAGADVALFYSAGHGVETHGLNYLVPTDANPANDGDVLAQGIGLAGILDDLEKASVKINLLLIDACRDNPFPERLAAVNAGLAQMQAPAGTMISFATQPHGVALDGDNGHSPYTRALAAAIQHPGYGLFRTFNEVGLAVEKATQGDQLPWVSSSPIDGRFYFAGKQVATAAPDAPSATSRSSPRPRHRLRPACGDALRHRTCAGPEGHRHGQDRHPVRDDRLQRGNEAISRRDALRVEAGRDRPCAQGLCSGANPLTKRLSPAAMPSQRTASAISFGRARRAEGHGPGGAMVQEGSRRGRACRHGRTRLALRNR